MTQWQVVPKTRSGGYRILTSAEVKAADERASQVLGVPSIALMESAGRAVAEVTQRRLEGQPSRPDARFVAVVAGRGNNGGDGLVAARLLADWGHTVLVVLCAHADALRGDAATALGAARAAGVAVIEVTDGEGFLQLPAPERFLIVVDALLGTGLTGEVHGVALDAITWMQGVKVPIVAVDLPSGVCADTGRVLGAAAPADETVTFGASRAGHWMFPGASLLGRLTIADIGLSELAMQGPERRLLSSTDLEPAFAERPADGHKGTFGHVYVLAGSPGRTGAARMACEAVLKAGAGLCTLGTTREAFNLVAGALLESMAEVALEPNERGISAAERVAARVNRLDAAVIGPGLPNDPEMADFIAALVPKLAVPAVLDAEALNLLVRRKELFEQGAAKVITPHPGEAARLLGRGVGEVQAARLDAARSLADDTACVVVLKGAHTVVASPDGRVWLCPDGNPGMGTAGMGDVLAGIIGALLGRGLEPVEAATAGVLWHARAGDLVAARRSQASLTAMDVVGALADVERTPC